jgi:hypothetical protein
MLRLRINDAGLSDSIVEQPSAFIVCKVADPRGDHD